MTIYQNPRLKCDGLAECPQCKEGQYIQSIMDDMATIRTCHKCEHEWCSGHGIIFTRVAVRIEAKYWYAYRLLDLLNAPDSERCSKPSIAKYLREQGFIFDKQDCNWKEAAVQCAGGCGATENLLTAYAGGGSFMICQSCNNEMERELS